MTECTADFSRHDPLKIEIADGLILRFAWNVWNVCRCGPGAGARKKKQAAGIRETLRGFQMRRCRSQITAVQDSQNRSRGALI